LKGCDSQGPEKAILFVYMLLQYLDMSKLILYYSASTYHHSLDAWSPMEYE